MKKLRLTRAQLEKMRDQGLVDAIAPGVPRKPTPEAPEEPEPVAPLVMQEPAMPRPVRLSVHRNGDGFIDYVDVYPLETRSLN